MGKHKKEKKEKKAKQQQVEQLSVTTSHQGHIELISHHGLNNLHEQNGHNGINGMQHNDHRVLVQHGQGSNGELLRRLNYALALEYAATIQYLQQHCSLRGQDRQQFAPFFAANSNEAHLHAQNLGNKIAALGGVPTIQPARIQAGETLAEMIRLDLEMEREALGAYVKAWEVAQGNPPLVFWLEEIISEEQLHVDELEKLIALHA